MKYPRRMHWSNLDLDHASRHDYGDALRCPCLPGVVIGRCCDEHPVTGVFTHDQNVARVLRSEGGHP